MSYEYKRRKFSVSLHRFKKLPTQNERCAGHSFFEAPGTCLNSQRISFHHIIICYEKQ
jgi:hypothetical protein